MKSIARFAFCLAAVFVSSRALATTELHVWEDEKKSKGITQAVADFEAQFDCKVKVEEMPFTSQIDKLRLDGPSGMGPDVLMIPADRVGAAVVQGLIAPVKFMQEDQDKYIRSAVSAFAQSGEIYAVPKVVETLVMFYNKDVLKKPFDTLDEYYDYSMKRVAAKKGEVGLVNDGAIKGVELVKKFYDNGLFPQSIIGDNGIVTIDNMFIGGKVGAVINGPWALEPYAKAKVNYGVTPLPILPNGKPMSSFLGVKGYVVSTWAKDHDLAEKFLQFINQPKYAKIRFVETQEIPPVKAVMADPVITNDDFANAIAVQASRAVPMPSIPEMSEVWGPIDGALQSAITGNAGVKEALKSATEHINYQIEAFRSGM